MESTLLIVGIITMVVALGIIPLFIDDIIINLVVALGIITLFSCVLLLSWLLHLKFSLSSYWILSLIASTLKLSELACFQRYSMGMVSRRGSNKRYWQPIWALVGWGHASTTTQNWGFDKWQGGHGWLLCNLSICLASHLNQKRWRQWRCCKGRRPSWLSSWGFISLYIWPNVIYGLLSITINTDHKPSFGFLEVSIGGYLI